MFRSRFAATPVSLFLLIGRRQLLALLMLTFVAVKVALGQGADPLPSWNEGATKQAILDFVSAVTREDLPDFVPLPQRIATFDNDGTLWVEQPMYVQLAFAIDRVKALAPLRPEWKDEEPYKAVLEGDMKALAASGEKGLCAACHENPCRHDDRAVCANC